MGPVKMNDQQIIDMIAKAAAQATLEHMDREKLKQRKFNRDRRLRNTKLLLKNYRSFVAHCDELQDKITAIQEAATLDELHGEEYAIESIKRSKQRTMVMTRFIGRMIEMYQRMCETSGSQEDIRRYKIIESLYISDKKMTVEQLAEFHNVEIRTIYNDINNASKALSVLVFGVDGLQFD